MPFNYTETLNYLYTQLPMFSKIGSAAIKNNLDNTIALCNFLNNPQQKFKSVHIAGTNGKGSCSHMLASVLQTTGLKVGLYTSPHLKDFRERIKINGQFIPEAFVIDFVNKTKAFADDIQPSFFELTVAMAFAYFAEEAVDIAIIETGLGGRLDSTNVITPLLSVIANIGWDHMNLLGNSLPLIATEKAGIIKPSVPVVIGETHPDTKNVFIQHAEKNNSEIFFADRNFKVINYGYDVDKLDVMVSYNKAENHTYTLDLNGGYQLKNLITVLQTLHLLKSYFTITQTDIAQGLKTVQKTTGLQGRWQVIQTNPFVVLEVAHNQDGVQQMLDHITTNLKIPFNQVHFIFGMVNDKAIDSVLQLLPKNANYYFSQAQIPRALPAAQLQQQAAAFGLNGQSFANVNLALAQAKNNYQPNQLIVVCGSIFLVAEVAY
jgi:dihydrofolate synthase / folylpolyglutamate synthase